MFHVVGSRGRVMRLAWCLLLAAFCLGRAHAGDDALSRVFAEAGARGTMVIEALDGGRRFVHDDVRAATRFPSASTFKIFNSLIALDTGAIAGPDELLVWDGHPYEFPDWNRSHTLASAYRVSCVWCYQELARRIGPETYRSHIRRAGYGKLSEPFDATAFWLDGSFRVSAVEQVAFLRRLIRRDLPYKASSYDALRDLMVVEQNDAFTLRAKTGWAARTTPQIGWYVGYVEARGAVWIFATNIDIADGVGLPARQQVTMAGLRAVGIL